MLDTLGQEVVGGFLKAILRMMGHKVCWLCILNAGCWRRDRITGIHLHGDDSPPCQATQP